MTLMTDDLVWLLTGRWPRLTIWLLVTDDHLSPIYLPFHLTVDYCSDTYLFIYIPDYFIDNAVPSCLNFVFTFDIYNLICCYICVIYLMIPFTFDDTLCIPHCSTVTLPLFPFIYLIPIYWLFITVFMILPLTGQAVFPLHWWLTDIYLVFLTDIVTLCYIDIWYILCLYHYHMSSGCLDRLKFVHFTFDTEVGWHSMTVTWHIHSPIFSDGGPLLCYTDDDHWFVDSHCWHIVVVVPYTFLMLLTPDCPLLWWWLTLFIYSVTFSCILIVGVVRGDALLMTTTLIYIVRYLLFLLYLFGIVMYCDPICRLLCYW